MIRGKTKKFFFIFYLFFVVPVFADNKIETVPLVNLEDLSPTFEEGKLELEKKQTQLDEAIKTNVYKKMLEVFSDAKLITVEENEEKE